MDKTFKKLKIYNILVGLGLLVQGIVMWAISNDTSVKITTNYLKWNSEIGFPTPETNALFDLKLGPIVALFLILSGVFLLGSSLIWRKNTSNRLARELISLDGQSIQ